MMGLSLKKVLIIVGLIVVAAVTYNIGKALDKPKTTNKPFKESEQTTKATPEVKQEQKSEQTPKVTTEIKPEQTQVPTDNKETLSTPVATNEKPGVTRNIQKIKEISGVPEGQEVKESVALVTDIYFMYNDAQILRYCTILFNNKSYDVQVPYDSKIKVNEKVNIGYVQFNKTNLISIFIKS